MAGTDGLARLYDRLSPDERLKLVVAAKARDDETEEDRLLRACPKQTYTMNDLAFWQRWQGAELLVAALMSDTARHIGWMEAVDVLCEPVEALLDGLIVTAQRWVDEHDLSDHDEAGARATDDDAAGAADPDDEQGCDSGNDTRFPVRAMQLAYDVSAALVRARWEAFGAVCREEIGVDPETLLAALWPELRARLDYYADAMAATPYADDPRTVAAREEWFKTGVAVWRKHRDLGDGANR
jgi:hypothetical protein